MSFLRYIGKDSKPIGASASPRNIKLFFESNTNAPLSVSPLVKPSFPASKSPNNMSP